MKLTITPPDGFDFDRCYRHLKQVVRTRSTKSTLRKKRGRRFVVSGPTPDLVMLKIALAPYDYEVAR